VTFRPSCSRWPDAQGRHADLPIVLTTKNVLHRHALAIARRVFSTAGRSFDLSVTVPSSGDLVQANRLLKTLTAEPRPWTFRSCDLSLRLPGTWHAAINPRSGCYPVITLRAPGVRVVLTELRATERASGRVLRESGRRFRVENHAPLRETPSRCGAGHLAGDRTAVIRLLRITAVFLASVAVAASAAGAAEQGRGPFLLVTLPSLGTVTWSCGGPRDREVALAFRVPVSDATTTVKFAAGHVARAATLQPGQSTRFPLLAPDTSASPSPQGTEARTLHATVMATFNNTQSYCFPYFPPRISVEVWQGR